MRRKIILFVIVGSMFIISLFKGCSWWNPTYHGTGYCVPAWSSDGIRIYYFRNDLTVKHHRGILTGGYYEWEKNEWYICSCDVNGGSRKTIYKVGEFSDKLPSELWRMIMDVSSDGKILYSVTTAIKGGIWTVNTDGSNDHQILSWGKNPRWVYNYTKIVFEGDGDKAGIWLMDRDGNNVSQVLTEGSSPAFCDANEKMLYHIWPAKGYGQLYCYSFTDSLIDTLIEGNWPDWNNTGEYFICNSQGNYSLFRSSSGELYIELPFTAGYSWVSRWWNSRIVANINGGIGVVNSDGTDDRIILENDFDHLYGD